MSASVIEVENLSKRYRLGVVGATTLRSEAAQWWARVRQPGSTDAAGEFWALRDVSFSVQRGEILGLLGRNGAGKSTLLKILSRITQPTAGQAVLRGRVSSLLEVGTGFHPDLTGRENVFLNGAILGMKKSEISARFDEIVAFAEIDQFIDTPVKHYSSGMRVRLAFAVAAHLDSEIMIIDEVLAVGDVEFQRKCIGKMEGVARSDGRTVLFVSHNLGAVQSLCSRALFLTRGRVSGDGDVEEQISAYLRDSVRDRDEIGGQPVALGRSLQLKRISFSPNPIISGAPLQFTVELVAHESIRITDLSLLLFSSYGSRITLIDLRSPSGPRTVCGPVRISGRVAAFPLVEADYRVGLYIRTGEMHDNFADLTTLTVTRRPGPTTTVPYPPHTRGFVELDTTLDV